MPRVASVAALLVSTLLDASAAGAQDRPATFRIARASGAIAVDGTLDDPGWKSAAPIDVWYETNPGDNVTPRVQNVGRLTYDERYFYVGLELGDPDPGAIKAPFSDRDNVDNTTDYAGVILDPRNDGKTGILFLANPRGIQYDAVSNDTTGNEDSSPDFFWDAAATIGEAGWTLEIRIPFSSLRYPTSDPQTWGFMLYRNWPREFRYQMPEKRPFFLEGVELLSTPIQAVYTRTITSPRYGGRITGRLGAAAYTALFAEDRGGGSAIVPGANGSTFADQDFRSWVGLARVRRDFGKSFASLLLSDREVEGGGFNRVVGPDLQWRPREGENVTGQLLWSFSRTPNRPELAEEWDGRSLDGHAANAYWNHSRPRHDWWLEYRDFGDGFRADNGFVPQVGIREMFLDTGWTFRPAGGPVRRLRTYLILDRTTDREGELISDELSPGFGLDARFNTFARIRWAWNDVRVGDGMQTLPRGRLLYVVNTSPARFLPQVNLEGFLGGEIDFENARKGSGGNVILGWTLRPTDHLELRLNNGRRWLCRRCAIPRCTSRRSRRRSPASAAPCSWPTS